MKIKPIGPSKTSPWQNVKGLPASSIPEGPLVYHLRATDGKGNVIPVTLKNGNIDPEGWLYIGEEQEDVDRLQNLVKGLQNGPSGPDPHGVGGKYYGGNYDKKYPYEGLQVQWTPLRSQPKAPSTNNPLSGLFDQPLPKGQPSDDKVMARVVERGELSTYRYKHADWPLFNQKAGYHTKKPPPPQSIGHADPDGPDPIEMPDPDSPEAQALDPRKKSPNTPGN